MDRKEVKTQYKWKVEDVFSCDEDWEKKAEELYGRLDFSKYAGKLGDRATLLSYLKELDSLTIELEHIAVYANLKRDEDTRVAKYNAYSGKIDMIYSRYCTATAFFEPEMASLDEKYLQSLVKDKDFSDYDYHIKLLIKRRAHVVSEKEEKLVALASETLGSFSDIFAMIDNADLPLPEMEFDGEKRKLSHGLYGLILHSSDREKREEAYKKYYAAYIGLLNTITANYYGNVKKDVFLSRVYNFDSCLAHALFSEDVSKKVYENLLDSVTKNCSVMHRYIADRKKILGYDKMYFYDIYAPLVENAKISMPYDKAYEYVVEGLAALGEEYQSLLKRGYEERWLDVEETEGKRSGAYSAGVYGLHPFVLLNYQPTLNDIFTIAHEMGHSLHTYFSQKNQPYAKSDYKIFVAEVASTVNEVLLLKYMVSKAEDVNLKKYLLNYYLDSIRATLHRQTMFAEFEYQAHKMVEEGNPLTRENLCETYAEIGKKYYGDAIEHDYEISTEWCRIPHFYSSFYVYKYSTGIISAINIANAILTQGDKAVKNYFKFLSGGSSTDPVSLLKLAGVNLEESAPFEFAMKEFENTLLEFEKLMEI